MAGSSVTITKREIENNKEHIDEWLISWVADDTNGSVPDAEIALSGALEHDKPINGWVFMAETNPGSPAPTANYDITIKNAAGADIFGGELADRSGSVTERVLPKIGSAYDKAWVSGILTFTLANNSVNSAAGTATLYVVRPQDTAGNLGKAFVEV